MQTPTISFEDILEFLEPLRPFLMDDAVTEIMVNPDMRVFVEDDGRKREIVGCRIKPDMLIAAARRIARAELKEINEENPICNARLGDGSSRVCLVIPPAAPEGPGMSIRKFRPRPFTMAELTANGSVPGHVWDILTDAVANHANILISGGMGSGKTTILNILARMIPADERIVLLEAPPEIQLAPNLNRFSLQASDDPFDEPSFKTLIRKAVVRLAPDRIILGEVRGEEALDLIRVLTLGHRGSLATLHSNDAVEALYTFTNLALSARPNLNQHLVRADASRAIDYVIQMGSTSQGKRQLLELVRVKPYNAKAEAFEVDPLFRHEESYQSKAQGA